MTHRITFEDRSIIWEERRVVARRVMAVGMGPCGWALTDNTDNVFGEPVAHHTGFVSQTWPDSKVVVIDFLNYMIENADPQQPVDVYVRIPQKMVPVISDAQVAGELVALAAKGTVVEFSTI